MNFQKQLERRQVYFLLVLLTSDALEHRSAVEGSSLQKPSMTCLLFSFVGTVLLFLCRSHQVGHSLVINLCLPGTCFLLCVIAAIQ